MTKNTCLKCTRDWSKYKQLSGDSLIGKELKRWFKSNKIGSSTNRFTNKTLDQ